MLDICQFVLWGCQNGGKDICKVKDRGCMCVDLGRREDVVVDCGALSVLCL